MMSSSPKLYPVGRDHPRPEDRITILGGPSALLGRVKFLIDDIVDLDVAAKHARRAAAWKKRMAPHRAIETCNAIIGAMCDAGRSGDAIDLFEFFFNKSEMKPNISYCQYDGERVFRCGTVPRCGQRFQQGKGNAPVRASCWSIQEHYYKVVSKREVIRC
ncbi:hypothetical protein DY000_02042809 [Brassica cretica]|uniref:Uncharacterized protein n=1 Tax=Brassica cretica TaxID=69181 RepID=A0ABQ7BI63_BRACR|nr:hypothetical protein DY000_02042809 [Brassica cretica]